MKTKRFNQSDAWVFASITTKEGDRLDQIIYVADLLNHSIPTEDEIENAVNKLLSADLIWVKKRLFGMTDIGEDIQNFAREQRGGLFTVIDRVEKQLNKKDLPALEIKKFKLKPGQLHEAYETHVSRFQETAITSKKQKRKISKETK